MADKRNITIQGETFEVTTPYTEGHVVNEAEARQLNQSRVEAVRNNTAKKVKEFIEAGDIEAARKTVSEYDAEYTFTIQTASGRTAVDPIDREARKIAREALKAHIEGQGGKLSDYEKDAIAAKVAEIAESNEAIRKEAEKRVKAQSKFLENVEGIEL